MASTSDLQQQALTFYSTKVGSLLSDFNTLSLILHDSSNCPAWLITGIIQQALSKDNECYLSPQAPKVTKATIPTFLYSFTNTEQTYSKCFQKYINSNKDFLKFTSYLSDSSKDPSKFSTDVLQDVGKVEEKPFVIIENPELLLSIVPGMTIIQLLSQLNEIQKHTTLYIVTSTSPNKSSLLSMLLHRSSLIITLTALTTGRADDMSGTLSVSPGPIKSKQNVSDRQYSYLVSTNNVKLFYK